MKSMFRSPFPRKEIMAKTKIETNETMDQLISEQFPDPGAESEGHYLDLNKWLADWKGRAVTHFKKLAQELREAHSETDVANDEIRRLTAKLDEAKTVVSNQNDEIQRQYEQIKELEKGVADGS